MIIKNIKAAKIYDYAIVAQAQLSLCSLATPHALFIEYKVSRQRDRWREIYGGNGVLAAPKHIKMLKARSHQFPLHKVMRYPRIRATFLK
jgi:hypothetical protein